MTKIASIAWLGSLILLMITAGSSWYDLTLSPEAGGVQVQVSGYLVSPIISALLLLQGAALLVSFLVPNTVARVIALVLAGLQAWHLIGLSLELNQAILIAGGAQVSELTGVVGQAQQQLIDSSSQTGFALFYLISVGANLSVLVLSSLTASTRRKKKPALEPEDDASTLWESQS